MLAIWILRIKVFTLGSTPLPFSPKSFGVLGSQPLLSSIHISLRSYSHLPLIPCSLCLFHLKTLCSHYFCSRHCLTLTFNSLTHLFVQLNRALLAACAGSSLHRAGSFVVAHRLSSCGSGAPEGAISVVSAHWFSCPRAHGILILWPGIKFMSPELQVRFLTPGPRGKFPAGIF